MFGRRLSVAACAAAVVTVATLRSPRSDGVVQSSELTGWRSGTSAADGAQPRQGRSGSGITAATAQPQQLRGGPVNTSAADGAHLGQSSSGKGSTAAAGQPQQARGSAVNRSKVLVFNLVHKTASRSVLQGLSKFGARLLVIREWEGLAPFMLRHGLNHDNAFVIGTVRNPCEWYVSNWKWDCSQAEKHGKKGRNFREKCGHDWNGKGGPPKFRDWFLKQPVQMTRHFHNNYVQEYFYDNRCAARCHNLDGQYCKHYCRNQPPVEFTKKCSTSDCLTGASGPRIPWTCPDGRDSTCAPAEGLPLITTFEPTLVDCWARLSSLDADLEKCLRRWRDTSAGGQTGTSGSGEARNTSFSSGFVPHVHQLDSMPCESFWTEDLERGVRSQDRPLFDAFGYTTCCGPPTIDRHP